MKKTKITYRQSLAIWQIHRLVPEEFKETIPAHTITKMQAITPMKIERSFPMKIGGRLRDKFGTWIITDMEGFMKDYNDTGKGEAPQAWVTLKNLKS